MIFRKKIIELTTFFLIVLKQKSPSNRKKKQQHDTTIFNDYFNVFNKMKNIHHDAFFFHWRESMPLNFSLQHSHTATNEQLLILSIE